MVEKKQVRIINPETGEVSETREAEFKRSRLSYGEKLKLKRQANIFKYATVNPKSIGEGKDTEFEYLDMEAWQNARADIEIELCRLLWGLTNFSIDKILDEDFEVLMQIIQGEDILGFKKDEEEAKKKLMDSLPKEENLNLSPETSTTK